MAIMSYSILDARHRRLRTANGLVRLSREIKLRTRVVRIFPNVVLNSLN